MSDGDETKNRTKGRRIEDEDTAVGGCHAIECQEPMVVGG